MPSERELLVNEVRQNINRADLALKRTVTSADPSVQEKYRKKNQAKAGDYAIKATYA